MKYSMDIIKRNEQLSIWNGAASIVAQSFMIGFIPLFAIQVLGASNFQIGLISSMPSFMTILAMIPGAIWINRLEMKKSFTAFNIFAARFSLFLISLIPFIPYTNHAWILVVCIGLLNFPNALATLSWQSFIGDLIPDERRGKFFMFVAGTVMLLFNQLLRVSPEENRTTFLANYNFLIAAMGCVAPQVGVYLLELLGVHFAMTFASVVRWIGAFSFLIVFYIEYTSKRKKKALKRPSIMI
jgi:hypothetical protein